ncbi:class I SAM-dependent methyltransferase [Mycolicibacterium sp. BiH015]|uniref:class I SAM-dependent methyltransferase n=1 Tax=Mycolicibacterium sp. BiH015 TaxID=3018808 RepID=UPI0022E3C5C6|nr:class I SAM-dependent methyltransferase [Mycolicibacterium sp. BiH015]MDA2895490.1 class I SAM-dependent methyltransferase [Mycolicibacterium sp. BiH015]
MTSVMELPDTALVTLWCRANEARRPDGIIDDPMAIRLLDSLDDDFDRFALTSGRQDLALRALAFDQSTRRYLAEHPHATVVALGEGLQTSFWRLDAADVGHDFRWLTVDLPPNIALREQLLPPSPRIAARAQSVLDFSWMDELKPEDGVFVSAEGLLPYLEVTEALSVIRECARRFPGGQMMFDLPPKLQAQLAARPRLWKALRGEWPRTPFSLTPDELANLNDLVPRVRATHNLPIPRGRGSLLSWLWRARDLRVYPHLRRMIGMNLHTVALLALLEFDE